MISRGIDECFHFRNLGGGGVLINWVGGGGIQGENYKDIWTPAVGETLIC